MVYEDPESYFIEQAITAINDLLARVEAAENERDRLREAMKPNCLQCESMHKNGNCMEVGGFCTSVPAAHCPLIPKLLKRTSEAEARAEKAERERDTAVFDLLRAEEAAEETNALLDDEVHLACDYSPYLAVYDSVSDIVNWERDDVWRGHKEE